MTTILAALAGFVLAVLALLGLCRAGARGRHADEILDALPPLRALPRLDEETR